MDGMDHALLPRPLFFEVLGMKGHLEGVKAVGVDRLPLGVADRFELTRHLAIDGKTVGVDRSPLDICQMGT